LTGLLYLENTLTSHAFTPDRISVLELLGAQAAISLENTRLYSDSREQRGKKSASVDSNIIRDLIRDHEGRILDANDAFLRMSIRSRGSRLRSHTLTDLTPPEWRDRDAVEELKMTGDAAQTVREGVLPEGRQTVSRYSSAQRVSRKGGNQGVAFVLDLTERKRAEEELHESERRHRETRWNSPMSSDHHHGQLTASIAHEVSQPIAAAVNQRQCRITLSCRPPPDLEEVREASNSVIKASKQAGEVIGRIRALIKKILRKRRPWISTKRSLKQSA